MEPARPLATAGYVPRFRMAELLDFCALTCPNCLLQLGIPAA